MRKKINLILVLAFVGLISAYNYGLTEQESLPSDLVLANAEALANGESSINNTGPSELFDCPWWFTGDGVHCKCENAYPCTYVPC